MNNIFFFIIILLLLLNLYYMYTYSKYYETFDSSLTPEQLKVITNLSPHLIAIKNLSDLANSLMKGSLTIPGGLNITGPLTVNGTTILKNNLSVDGETNLKKKLSASGGGITGGLTVTGGVSVKDGLTVEKEGATIIKNNLTVDGDSNLKKNLTVGNDTTLVNVSCNALSSKTITNAGDIDNLNGFISGKNIKATGYIRAYKFVMPGNGFDVKMYCPGEERIRFKNDSDKKLRYVDMYFDDTTNYDTGVVAKRWKLGDDKFIARHGD